jgi:hypothetical protein
MVEVCINTASQWTGISLGKVAGSGNFDHIGPKIFLSPLTGLVTSCRYIAAAQDFKERGARVATLAALLSSSIGCAVTTDPATNIAMATVISSKISYMEGILKVRGGSHFHSISQHFLILSVNDFPIIANPIKNQVVHPSLSLAQIQFQ